MKFCVDLLSSQSRKQLQAFAKENGIRANASNASIIESLLSLTSTISCGSPAVNIDAYCTNEENEVVSIDEVLQVSDNPDHLDERGHGSSSSCAVIEEVEDSGDTNHVDRQEWAIGSRVEASVDDVWTAGVIVKQNKKSYRVRFDSNSEESLIKFNNVRLTTLGNSTLKDISTDALCSVQKVDEVVPTSALLFYSSSEFESEKVVKANAPQKSPMCDQNVALRRAGKSGGSVECKSSEKSHFGERQRSVGGTPIKSLSRPLFMPKSTKNQRVRLDASHLKRTTLSDLGSRKASIVCMPSIGNAQSSEPTRTPLKSIASGGVTFRPPNLTVSSVTKASEHCLPSAKLSSPLRSTPSKSRNGVPNFQKMHQKLMSNLKPITEIVKRVSIRLHLLFDIRMSEKW